HRTCAGGWPGADSPHVPGAAAARPTTKRNIRTNTEEYRTGTRPGYPRGYAPRRRVRSATTQGRRATTWPAPASTTQPVRRTESSALHAAAPKCESAGAKGRFGCCARRAERQLKIGRAHV